MAKVLGILLAVILIVAAASSFLPFGGGSSFRMAGATTNANAQGTPNGIRSAEGARDALNLDLSDSQLAAVKVEPVEEREFPVEKEAVGSIGFNEELETQVFTPYQGKIIQTFAKVGDEVKKGQTLFTIDSPDLLNAEANLISAAGVLDQSTRVLERGRELYKSHAISQAELEMDISNQQTAEGNVRTGRDVVRIFGKTDAEIDQIIKDRRADPALIVPSPIDGRITQRNAASGLLVQPAMPPAPYVVTDVDTMWMLANVAETASPAFRVGQPLKVKLSAFPNREFDGTVTVVSGMVDPNTRRVLVRSEIKDPQHELRSGMFGTFTISVGAPLRSPAVPLAGVVRAADGTQTVWVTADRRRFTKRTVVIGKAILKPVPVGVSPNLPREGYRQILEGLQPGELVASVGAVNLDNMVNIAAVKSKTPGSGGTPNR